MRQPVRTVVVLALDLGVAAGWSVVRTGDPDLGVRWVDDVPGPVRVHGSGPIDLTPPPRSGPGWRWARWRDRLDLVLDAHPGVTHLAYEDVVHHSSTLSAHVYGALRSGAELAAWERGLPVVGVSVTDVKRAATGKGGGPGLKAATVAWARALVGRLVESDEADALACGVAAGRYLAARTPEELTAGALSRAGTTGGR